MIDVVAFLGTARMLTRVFYPVTGPVVFEHSGWWLPALATVINESFVGRYDVRNLFLIKLHAQVVGSTDNFCLN